jgi:hypothetical protein
MGMVNSWRLALDVPPHIKDGTTVVPLRFVAENLKCDVMWVAGTQAITIVYPMEKISMGM